MANRQRSVREPVGRAPSERDDGPSVPILSNEDVADRLAAVESTFERPTAGGVCVADGYGVRITVERGALEVHDGIGQARRTRYFDRATHGLSRIVVGNVTGAVTFDALRWCEALGIGVLVLGPDDAPLLTSVPRATDDARLRRMQALAPDLPVGLDLARFFISEKITGEARVLSTHFGAHDEASTLLELAGVAESPTTTIDEVRQVEATAAASYWQTWAGRSEAVPTFAAADRRRIPGNWTRFDSRRSVLASANGNRRAERPTNALLNYAFSLLEAEAVMACRAVGLDPGMALIHLDARSRQSMALDLVEPVRSDVEAFVLDLLATRTFKKADFAQLPDGHCRLMAPLTHELAEMLPRWAALIAPVAEKVAHSLGDAIAGKYVAVTPLTRRRSREAAAHVNARKAVAARRATASAPHQRPGSPANAPVYSCPSCGGTVANPRHIRCDDCIAKDPRQAPAVRASRGRAILARKRALRERADAELPEHCDRDWYSREVLPQLANHKLVEIMAAAGCSKGYASTIRKGTYVPHVSTWSALAKLVGVEVTELAAH